MGVALAPASVPEEVRVVQIEPVGPVEIQDGGVAVKAGQGPDVLLEPGLFEVRFVRPDEIRDENENDWNAVLFKDGQEFCQVLALGSRPGLVTAGLERPALPGV